LKESSRACSFAVIPWRCPHPKPTFPGSPLQHQQFLPSININQILQVPYAQPSLPVPMLLVQSASALGRVVEGKTKAMQPGSGGLSWGHGRQRRGGDMEAGGHVDAVGTALSCVL